MTQEEKAKAYDEALKVLHKYDGAHIMFTQDLKEEMFPELKESKESEDEKIRKDIEFFIAAYHKEDAEKAHWLAWLEKQGEQKPAWSEEDDDNIMMIEDRFSDYLDYIREDSSITKHQKNSLKEEIIGYVNWLKSLRPQNRWKPSDMQLEVLRLAAEKDGTCLMGLYEQLKKLTEE